MKANIRIILAISLVLLLLLIPTVSAKTACIGARGQLEQAIRAELKEYEQVMGEGGKELVDQIVRETVDRILGEWTTQSDRSFTEYITENAAEGKWLIRDNPVTGVKEMLVGVKHTKEGNRVKIEAEYAPISEAIAGPMREGVTGLKSYLMTAKTPESTLMLSKLLAHEARILPDPATTTSQTMGAHRQGKSLIVEGIEIQNRRLQQLHTAQRATRRYAEGELTVNQAMDRMISPKEAMQFGQQHFLARNALKIQAFRDGIAAELTTRMPTADLNLALIQLSGQSMKTANSIGMGDALIARASELLQKATKMESAGQRQKEFWFTHEGSTEVLIRETTAALESVVRQLNAEFPFTIEMTGGASKVDVSRRTTDATKNRELVEDAINEATVAAKKAFLDRERAVEHWEVHDVANAVKNKPANRHKDYYDTFELGTAIDFITLKKRRDELQFEYEEIRKLGDAAPRQRVEEFMQVYNKFLRETDTVFRAHEKWTDKTGSKPLENGEYFKYLLTKIGEKGDVVVISDIDNVGKINRVMTDLTFEMAQLVYKFTKEQAIFDVNQVDLMKIINERAPERLKELMEEVPELAASAEKVAKMWTEGIRKEVKREDGTTEVTVEGSLLKNVFRDMMSEALGERQAQLRGEPAKDVEKFKIDNAGELGDRIIKAMDFQMETILQESGIAQAIRDRVSEMLRSEGFTDAEIAQYMRENSVGRQFAQGGDERMLLIPKEFAGEARKVLQDMIDQFGVDLGYGFSAGGVRIDDVSGITGKPSSEQVARLIEQADLAETIAKNKPGKAFAVMAHEQLPPAEARIISDKIVAELQSAKEAALKGDFTALDKIDGILATINKGAWDIAFGDFVKPGGELREAAEQAKAAVSAAEQAREYQHVYRTRSVPEQLTIMEALSSPGVRKILETTTKGESAINNIEAARQLLEAPRGLPKEVYDRMALEFAINEQYYPNAHEAIKREAIDRFSAEARERGITPEEIFNELLQRGKDLMVDELRLMDPRINFELLLKSGLIPKIENYIDNKGQFGIDEMVLDPNYFSAATPRQLVERLAKTATTVEGLRQDAIQQEVIIEVLRNKLSQAEAELSNPDLTPESRTQNQELKSKLEKALEFEPIQKRVNLMRHLETVPELFTRADKVVADKVFWEHPEMQTALRTKINEIEQMVRTLADKSRAEGQDIAPILNEMTQIKLELRKIDLELRKELTAEDRAIIVEYILQ